MWKQGWTLLEAIPLGSKILVAILAEPEGQKICVTSAHFHHRAAQRREQWHALTATLQCITCPHKILLADHNSLIVPSTDSSLVYKDKTTAIAEAWETDS